MKMEYLLSRSRKAQVSTIDFITGITLLTIAIVLSVNIIIGMQDPSTFHSVKKQSIAASDSLMSEGYPASWNASSVVRVGLLSDNALNLTKLSLAGTLSYDELRASLNGVQHIYWYFMNSSSVINFSRCGYGDSSIPTSADCVPIITHDNNLVRIDRFVSFNNSIIRLVVLSWD